MKSAVRRRATRLPTSLEGSLSGRTARRAIVRDLSATGCLVHCDALLDPGSIHDLDLRLADQPWRAKVRVTESSVDGASASLAEGVRQYLVGLEFLGLPVQAATRLRRFLEEEKRRRPAR